MWTTNKATKLLKYGNKVSRTFFRGISELSHKNTILVGSKKKFKLLF